jgi:N-acetylmuramoyl-L-alanine amidase
MLGVRLPTSQPAKVGLAGIALAVIVIAGLATARSVSSPASDPGSRAVAAAGAGASPPATPPALPAVTASATASASPSGPPPDPNPHVGSSGPAVLAIQQKLASLDYMVGTPDGQFGAATRDGLIAFQKVEGLPRTGEADPATIAKLQTATAPTPAYATPADHVELDIAHQVVYVVRGGAVTAVLPTSTGTGQPFTSQGWTRRAVTQNGVFSIYWKVDGWHQAPLGDLYKPSFFNDGEAFHGYPEVPTYPASHGCARLPMEFADWFYANAVPYGETVYVYGGPTGPNPDPVTQSSTVTSAPPSISASTPPAASPAPSPSPSPAPGSLLGGLLPLPSPSAMPNPTPSPTPSPVLSPAPSPSPSPPLPPSPYPPSPAPS